MYDPNIALNLPNNTPNWSTGGNYGSNLFSSLAGATSNFIKQKPEQFSIIADAIGSRLDPNNPFAGVGTMMGKSSLANKAADETKSKQDLLMQLIKGLSAKNLPGGNALTITTGADGSPEITYKGNLGKLDGPTTTPTEASDPHKFLQSLSVE